MLIELQCDVGPAMHIGEYNYSALAMFCCFGIRCQTELVHSTKPCMCVVFS
jgi:hypothetical protein